MPQKAASNCREVIARHGKGKAVRCQNIGNRSGYCPKHYKQWIKNVRRCDYEGCTNILTRPGNGPKSKRINGRRMRWPDGKVHALCRFHEVLHLRLTPSIEQLNLARLAQGIQPGGPNGECWIWSEGKGKHNDDTYPLMDPEGSNGDDWFTHRVSWYLLNSTGWGHSQSKQIAHRCNVRSCINPAHLEPATPTANAKDKTRKARSASRKYWGPAAHNFAVKNNLPNPFPLREWDKSNPWDDGLVVEPVTEYGMPELQGIK